MEGTCLRLRQNQPQLARRCPLALALALPLVLALDLALAQRVAQFRKDISQFSIRAQHLYLILAGSTEHRQPMRSHFTKSNISKLKTQESKMDWYICMLVQAGPGHPPNQHGNINGASFDHDLPRQKVPSVLVHGLLDFWTFD